MLKVKKGKSIVGAKFNVLNSCAKSRTDKFFKESVLYFFLRLTRETFWDEKTTKGAFLPSSCHLKKNNYPFRVPKTANSVCVPKNN